MMIKKNNYSHISLAPFWCLGSAILISLCWLLPNNARPWSSFHSDAWIACVLMPLSLVVYWRGSARIDIHVLPLVVLLAGAVSLLQFWSSILPFSGQLWIAEAYLLGFCLAIFTGQQWQHWSPQWMERILFSAFISAGVISVFIALHQWLRLGESAGLTDIWILPFPSDLLRPYANMAQPNQLATLLLWALLGSAWATYRGYIKIVGGVCIAGFLVVGLALTQSRSGMLGVLIALCACWSWRNLFKLRSFTFCLIGLTAWYVLLLTVLPSFGRMLLLETAANFVERSINESRLDIWRMVIDGAKKQPWTGFGWNQVLPAQIAVSESHPEVVGKYIAQSHNLFLDFIVWTGFPFGLFLTGVVIAWVWTAGRRVRNESQAIYLLVIVVTGLHAMVELPLHYAYFLLPVGLMVGSLNSSMNIWPVRKLSRNFALALWLYLAVMLGLVINDYFRLESAYNDIRFEKANFVNAPKTHIPQALVLNHLQYIIELYSMTPVEGLSDEVVERFVDTTTFLPSAYNISKLVVILALNGRPDAARLWMKKAKTMMSPDNYAAAQKDWVRAAGQFPAIAATLRLQD